MAIFTRVNGDVQGVVNVDKGRTAGNIISTGLTKNPTVFKVDPGVDVRAEMVTGGAVETILRAFGVDCTVVMYEVENTADGNIAVLVEAVGSNASVIQTRVQALSNSSGASNIGLASNVWAPDITVVNSGFVLK